MLCLQAYMDQAWISTHTTFAENTHHICRDTSSASMLWCCHVSSYLTSINETVFFVFSETTWWCHVKHVPSLATSGEKRGNSELHSSQLGIKNCQIPVSISQSYTCELGFHCGDKLKNSKAFWMFVHQPSVVHADLPLYSCDCLVDDFSTGIYCNSKDIINPANCQPIILTDTSNDKESVKHPRHSAWHSQPSSWAPRQSAGRPTCTDHFCGYLGVLGTPMILVKPSQNLNGNHGSQNIGHTSILIN